MGRQETYGALAADSRAACDIAVLYARWGDDIHTYASRLLGSQEEADDVTQEVFLAAYQHWPPSGDAIGERAWLYRAATNRCLNVLRRRRVIAWLPLSRWQEQAGTGDPVGEATVRRDVVRRALAALSPRDAAILLLHAAQGLTYQEIAASLGLSPGAAATAISRAQARFARHYTSLTKE